MGMSGGGGSSSKQSGTSTSAQFQQNTGLSQLISQLLGFGSSTGTTTGTMSGTSSGTSSGSGIGTTSSPFASLLARIGQGIGQTGQAVTGTVGRQMLEALRTGGINAAIPWITRNLDAVRQAGSSGIQSIRQAMGRAGFGNTAAGQAQIAQATQQANQNTAAVPSQAVQSLIQEAPAFGTSAAATGTGAISAAQPFSATTTEQQQNQFQSQTAEQTASQTAEQYTYQQIQNAIQNMITQMIQRGVGTTNESTSNSPGFWNLLNMGSNSPLSSLFNPIGTSIGSGLSSVGNDLGSFLSGLGQDASSLVGSAASGIGSLLGF